MFVAAVCMRCLPLVAGRRRHGGAAGERLLEAAAVAARLRQGHREAATEGRTEEGEGGGEVM